MRRSTVLNLTLQLAFHAYTVYLSAIQDPVNSNIICEREYFKKFALVEPIPKSLSKQTTSLALSKPKLKGRIKFQQGPEL
jgi:hypothetical protein